MKDQDRTEADVVGSFHGLRVLVIGDALLDTFLEGSAPRISREAPIPVVEQQAEHHFPGGAANAAANLSALGAEVAFVGMVGDDVTGTSLRSALQEAGVDDRWLVTDPNVTTARKLRVLAHDQYLVRVDEGSLSACAPDARRALLNHVESLGPQSDLIVISDYGYSTVSEEIVEWLCKLRADHPCTLAIDSRDVCRFSRAGATLVTPNLEEARVAVAPGNPSEAEPMDVARRLREKLDAENIAITMGGDGVLLADAEGHITHLPTRPIRKPDDVGAGDSFIAAAALALATGARPELAARIGIDAATIVCTKPRVAVVTSRELLRRVSLSQQRAPSAPLSVKEIAGRRIVFTNGVFDIVHAGHVRLLQQARTLGDVLVVGINSDASVRRLKGDLRPINREQDRLAVIAALDAVDYALIFAEDTPAETIVALRPDIHVKGGDYIADALPEIEAVREVGAQVEILPLLGGLSTTNVIERIVSLNTVETRNGTP